MANSIRLRLVSCFYHVLSEQKKIGRKSTWKCHLDAYLMQQSSMQQSSMNHDYMPYNEAKWSKGSNEGSHDDSANKEVPNSLSINENMNTISENDYKNTKSKHGDGFESSIINDRISTAFGEMPSFNANSHRCTNFSQCCKRDWLKEIFLQCVNQSKDSNLQSRMSIYDAAIVHEDSNSDFQHNAEGHHGEKELYTRPLKDSNAIPSEFSSQRLLRQLLLAIIRPQSREEERYYWRTLNRWIKNFEISSSMKIHNSNGNLQDQKNQQESQLDQQGQQIQNSRFTHQENGNAEHLFQKYLENIQEVHQNNPTILHELHQNNFRCNDDTTSSNSNIIPMTLSKNKKHTSLTKMQILELQNLTGWDIRYIKKRFLYAKQKSCKLSYEQKRFLKEWLKNNEYPTTQEEKLLLMNEAQRITNNPITLERLTKYLYNNKYKRGQITKENKLLILQYLRRLERLPTHKERERLSNELQLSPMQIYTQIKIFQRKGLLVDVLGSKASKPTTHDSTLQLTEELNVPPELTRSIKVNTIKQFLMSKYANTKFLREIASKDKEMLRKELKMDIHELNQFLQYYMQRPGKIDKHSKSIIQKWLQEHEYRMPNPEELTILLNLSGLSRPQLRMQLRNLIYSNNVSEITFEAKEHIIEWLQRNDFVVPSLETRTNMANQLGISTKQIYDFCRRYNDKFNSAKLNKAMKYNIINWIKENGRIPTSTERESLQKKYEISRQQLNGLIRRSKYILNEEVPFASSSSHPP